jgi:hypothetical protein
MNPPTFKDNYLLIVPTKELNYQLIGQVFVYISWQNSHIKSKDFSERSLIKYEKMDVAPSI